MVSNPYQAYAPKQKVNNDRVGDFIAHYFEEACAHMRKATDAIRNNDIETRYVESQQAATIIRGLASGLKCESKDQEQVVQVQHDYYASMISGITRVNVNNDADLCSQIADSFAEMAKGWRQAAVQYATETEAPAEPDAQNSEKTTNVSA
ncbi:MAG: flagellar protein FliS [Alphaproteobacteria bacterium]